MDHPPTSLASNSGLSNNSADDQVKRTRRLAINAAFLKDIKDDNRELKVLLDRLCPLTEHPQTARNHWPELIRLLADLRDQLALHFSLEEAFGYFEEAIETAPQLSLRAEQLRHEHIHLFERVRGLADKSPEIEPDGTEKIAAFLEDFQQFLRSFELHEEAEVQLILASLEDDLGEGD